MVCRLVDAELRMPSVDKSVEDGQRDAPEESSYELRLCMFAEKNIGQRGLCKSPDRSEQREK
jgi:hypothetical protein